MANALVPVSPRRDRGATENVDTKGKPVTYLDFSFLDVTQMGDLENESPRPNVFRRKINRDDEGKYETNCLRINNNVLQHLNGFANAISKTLMHPDEIAWLDLSQNELTTIDPVLCDFRSLKFLYLHGNAINDCLEAEKLGGLPSLIKLTLHGNPMENTKGYRMIVLSMIPQLRSLDFSAVTKADRATLATWYKTNPLKKKKRRRSEDD